MYFIPVMTNCALTVPTVLTININLKLFWNGELVNCGLGRASELEHIYVAVVLFTWGLWFHLVSSIQFFMLTNPTKMSSLRILLLSCPLRILPVLSLSVQSKLTQCISGCSLFIQTCSLLFSGGCREELLSPLNRLRWWFSVVTHTPLANIALHWQSQKLKQMVKFSLKQNLSMDHIWALNKYKVQNLPSLNSYWQNFPHWLVCL